MKILYVAFEMPPYMGGGSSYSKNLVKNLATPDNQIVVVTSGEKDTEDSWGDNIVLKRFKNIKDIYENKGNYLKAVDDLIRVVQEFKPDIIQTQQYIETLLMEIVNTNFSIPLVVTHHKTPEYSEEAIKKNSKWSCFDFVNNNSVSKYIASSKVFRETLLQTVGSVNPNKIELVYPGVSDQFKKLESLKDAQKLKEKLGIDDSKKVILLPLRIRKRKGLEFALDSLVQFIKKNKDIKVILTGTPSSDEYSKTIWSNYKKRLENVFVDHIDSFTDEEMVFLYNFANVSILPSQSEGLGLSLIEAMSCGCPVIGANVYGINEIIVDKKNGRLIEYGNQESFIESLEDILGGKNNNKYTEDALKTVNDKFNSVKQAAQQTKIYNEILSTTKVSSGGIIYRKKDSAIEVYVCKHKQDGVVLPKGGIKPGETVIECARREISEETGYVVSNPNYSLGELQYEFTDKNGRRFSKKVYFFAFQTDQNQNQKALSLEDGEEILLGKWCSKNEAIDLLSHKSEKEKVSFLFDLLRQEL